MTTHSLILTKDPGIVDPIREKLAEVACDDFLVTDDGKCASAWLTSASQPRIFIDLRDDEFVPEVETFLTALIELNSATAAVFSIVDDTIPQRIATMVDMLTLAYIKHPAQGPQIEQAFAALPDGDVYRAVSRTVVRRVLETNGIRLATYTPRLFPVIDQIERIAALDVTLLFIGETGTGKTTLAQQIHYLSTRCDEPFQNVACGALPPDLIESDLFGHVRGAFTGADRSKIGRFEAAAGGTLLLDEIDVLDPKQQAKLLRVIETGEFEPVGSTETRYSKARVIVASNVDLEELAEQNKFRSDLYYRLSVLEFNLPPLRERSLDIVSLAMQFIEDSGRQFGVEVKRIHLEFLQMIKNYDWPGNIRQLKNHIQRAILFCENGELTAESVAPILKRTTEAAALPVQEKPPVAPAEPVTLADQVASSERAILTEALQKHGYKRTATAKALGISRVGLYKKMRKLGMLELEKSTSPN